MLTEYARFFNKSRCGLIAPDYEFRLKTTLELLNGSGHYHIALLATA